MALRRMQRHLLANAGAHFSVQKFYNALRSQGLPVSKDTLHAYLGHLEDTFLIRTVNLHTASERQRMVNPRKAYPVDPGLIPVYERTGRPNLGHALETVVLIELERRGYQTAYIRTREGLEVDFLAQAAGQPPTLIQVCLDTFRPGDMGTGGACAVGCCSGDSRQLGLAFDPGFNTAETAIAGPSALALGRRLVAGFV